MPVAGKTGDQKIRGDDQRMEPLTEEHKEYGVKGHTNAVYDQLTKLHVSPCRVRLPVSMASVVCNLGKSSNVVIARV